MHPLRKLGALLVESKIYNAFGQFVGPFRAQGLYVNDGRGDTVCECRDQQTAKMIAGFLIEKFPPPASKK